MKKSIWLTAFGSFITILYLVLFIKSYEYYSDEYGTDISFDEDMLTLLIVGVIVLAIGIISIVYFKKEKSMYEVNLYGYGTIGLIMTFKPLGEMFRAIAKDKALTTIVDYLLWSFVGMFIIARVVIYYLDNHKKEIK